MKLAVLAAALLGSAALTEVYRRYALRCGLLDMPNARSSHVVPTPRGGGVAIVIVTCLALSLLRLRGHITSTSMLMVLLGVPVAIIGFIDDRHPVPVKIRLAVHFASAFAATGVIMWLFPLALPFDLGEFALMLTLSTAIVWVINLFNFMDGIDGIAASEATFIAGAAGALTMHTHGSLEIAIMSGTFSAVCAGFLLRNWPPARIFMGDVGSGYIGFVIAALALLSAAHRTSDLYVWLILGATFITDSTITLVTRYSLGDVVTAAHRTHAYQHLAMRFRSHRRVTVGFTCVNLVWLLPLAAVSGFRPALAPYLTFVAYFPLVLLAVCAGAGRRHMRRPDLS